MAEKEKKNKNTRNFKVLCVSRKRDDHEAKNAHKIKLILSISLT